MKRVVIIGSKPDADIPNGDIIYCANTSLSLYSESIKKFDNIVVVILNTALNHLQKNRDDNNQHRDFNVRTWNMITSVPEKLVIISEKSIEKTINALTKGGYTGKIHHITKYDRRMLTGKISGCRDPIITKDFWGLSKNMQIECIKSLIKAVLFKRIISKKADVNCVLRPSTGIHSIIYAISEQGVNAEYVISGIDLKNRGVYSDGKNEEKSKQNPFSHIFADQKALKKLVKKHNIFTIEHELMHIVPKLKGWHMS